MDMIFCDSDYEVELGDADLFDENLEEVVGKCDKKAKGTKLKSTVVDRTLGDSDNEKTYVERLDIPHSDSDGEGYF